MKELSIKKKKADKKELENWILRNTDNNIGIIAIDGSKISAVNWMVLTKKEGQDLNDELENYNTVFFYDYEDIEKGSISKNLDVDVLKDAIKRLVDSCPQKPSDDVIIGGLSNITIFHVMHKSVEISHRLLVFPGIGLRQYNRYYKWDEKEKQYFLDFYDYLLFFVDNIQQYKDHYPDGEDAPPVRMYEGLSVNEYFKKYVGKNIKKQADAIYRVWHQRELKSIKEEQCDLILLQRKLELEGKQVCFVNFILLAEFIKEKCESRYFAILEPTIDDILDSIEKLEGVSRVVFEDDKGNKVICEKEEHIELLKEDLRNKSYIDRRVFEVKEIKQWSELADKSIIQALFVQDMIQFLNKYFPGRRKKGSLVSTAEQELISWAMFHVGLSDTKVCDSRFRQLKIFNTNSNIDSHPQYKILPEWFEKVIGTRIIAIDYLSWEQDIDNIDWFQPIKKMEFREGDVIQDFSHKILPFYNDTSHDIFQIYKESINYLKKIGHC